MSESPPLKVLSLVVIEVICHCR